MALQNNTEFASHSMPESMLCNQIRQPKNKYVKSFRKQETTKPQLAARLSFFFSCMKLDANIFVHGHVVTHAWI
jgi:hypothetical protein